MLREPKWSHGDPFRLPGNPWGPGFSGGCSGKEKRGRAQHKLPKRCDKPVWKQTVSDQLAELARINHTVSSLEKENESNKVN